MGNRQSIDYSLGYYEDSDSGFFDPNINDIFIDSVPSIEHTATSTPKKLDKSFKEFKLDLVQEERDTRQTEDDLSLILNQPRRPSLVKSKSIGINIRNLNAKFDSYQNSSDEEDDVANGDDDSFKNSLNNSIYSSTWSPSTNNLNSNLRAKKPKLKQSLSTESGANNLIVKGADTAAYSFSFKKGMDYFREVAKGFKNFYNEINPATLTGAIDVVVVEQEDGSFRCSPFHVRFGKIGVIRSKEIMVDIEINGLPVDLHMKLGEAGEAYFVEEITDSDEEESSSCESIPNSLKISKTTSDLERLSQAKLKPNPVDLMSSSVPQMSQPIPINNEQLPIAQLSASLSPRVDDEILPGPQSSNVIAESATIKIPNFFSDGDITPELTSPAVSRPQTPKSDTELDVRMNANKLKRNSMSQIADNSSEWSWSWGQLPERQNSLTSKNDTLIAELKEDLISNKEPVNGNVKQEVNASSAPSSSSSRILGSMLNLIGSTNGVTTASAPIKSTKNLDGIYLDEVTDKLDSEVAALYINQKSNAQKLTVQTNQQKIAKLDDDQESGNGQSLPQSPRDHYSLLGDVQISLCGFISSPGSTSTTNLSSPNANSSLLSSLSLASKQAESSTGLTVPMSQTQSVSPATSTSSLLQISPSLQANQSGPSSPSYSDLSVSYTNPSIQLQLPQINPEQATVQFEDLFQQYAISFEKFLDEMSTLSQNPNLVIKINNRYMNWQSASPIILSAVVYHRQLTNDQISSIVEANMPKLKSQVMAQPQQQPALSAKSTKTSWGLFSWPKKSSSNQTANNLGSSSSSTNLATKTTTTTTTLISTTTTTVEATRPSSLLTTKPQSYNSNYNDYGLLMDEDLLSPVQSCKTKEQQDEENDNNANSENDLTDDTQNYYQKKLKQHFNRSKKQKYKKTTRLSSDMIKKLKLNFGSNEIKFSVTTALQGTTRITSYIFLWNYDDKIIVSDIDGTITKSDVWGQVLPIFGRDWTQSGVADLFTAIERNQYKFIYLSARAIGQSQITRNLLKKINQDGFTLPEGPLLVTPTSLFQAFQKEVIEKKPEEFKIRCLKDIKSLFPSDNNPYYAGYGNKTSDVTSYKTVGIPVSRIFTINPQGEVKHEVSRTFQSSYSKLCDYVDLIFPPFKASGSVIKAEYDSFNYWRNSVIDDSILNEIENEMKKSLISGKESKDAKDKKVKSQASNLSLS